jgi:hypothetical protein
MTAPKWKQQFEQFPAMRQLAYGEKAPADRTADGIASLQEPRDHMGRRVQYSAAARFHPEISAGIDRAQKIPPMFDMKAVRQRLPRILGNTGRRLLPMRPGGYSRDDLQKHELGQLSEREQRGRDADYEQLLDALEHGGEPTEAVIVHSEVWSYELPDIRRDLITDEERMQVSGTATVLAHAVPITWSQRRVARVVAHGCPDCYWCESWVIRGHDDYLLVPCGATMRVFPTCDGCRTRFARDLEWEPGLDYVSASDRWFPEVGSPDDRYI